MCEAGTSFVLCPIFGYLVDRGRTRRLPFITALVVLAGCMVVLQLSRSIAGFVAARLLQGVAGALVVVAAFALIGDAVPHDRLGQTIGYLGSAIASGFLLGPFLGGMVYNAGGYNAVFWFSYPVLALDMVLRLVLVEKKVAAQWAGQSEDLESDLETEPRTPRVEPELQPRPVSQRQGFVMFRMLKQRRVLISSWALLVQGLLLSAFDAVRSRSNPKDDQLIILDTSNLCRNNIWLECAGHGADFPADGSPRLLRAPIRLHHGPIRCSIYVFCLFRPSLALACMSPIRGKKLHRADCSASLLAIHHGNFYPCLRSGHVCRDSAGAHVHGAKESWDTRSQGCSGAGIRVAEYVSVRGSVLRAPLGRVCGVPIWVGRDDGHFGRVGGADCASDVVVRRGGGDLNR